MLSRSFRVTMDLDVESIPGTLSVRLEYLVGFEK